MSSLKFELEAEVRRDIGKGASRRLRHANKVPAVIYGADQELSVTYVRSRQRLQLHSLMKRFIHIF